MPGKFRCEEVLGDEEQAEIAKAKVEKREPVITKEMKLDRKRALIPVNDAAKATVNAIQYAIDAGVYRPAKGESPEEMKEKLRKREAEFAKLGKGLPT